MKPVLQVALDFVDLARAMKVAREAAAAGIGVFEAGTPLIKACGLEAVRALRKEFPRAKIVADMKIMDAGRTEAEIAFKAGANVVTVMGGASDATIREAVEAAANYGGEVMADLMEAAATLKRAKRIERLGVAALGVHLPIDEQMEGKIEFSFLKEVVANVTIPVAIAGGINSENVVAAVKAGASILIVGGAVTKASDTGKEIGRILKAVGTGKAVPTVLYRRVSEEHIREILLLVSAANISDALHRRGWLEGIHPVVSSVKMAGPAITVRTLPGDWAKPVEAVDMAGEGDVIVIDAGGVPPAVWGELATTSCVGRKVAGVVINGMARDIGDIRKLKFPLFAKLTGPQAGEPKGFGEINVPLRIGGVSVNPGDWIAGDDDGVVVIPKEQIVETVNRAMDVLEKENRIRTEIGDGNTLSGVMELLKWEKPK